MIVWNQKAGSLINTKLVNIRPGTRADRMAPLCACIVEAAKPTESYKGNKESAHILPSSSNRGRELYILTDSTGKKQIDLPFHGKTFGA